MNFPAPSAIEPSFQPYKGHPSIGLCHTPNCTGAYSSYATHGDILWSKEGQHAVNLTYTNVDEAGLTYDEATAAANITMDVVRAYCHRNEESPGRKIRAELLATMESYSMGEESCIMALAKHVAFTFITFVTTFGYSSELASSSTYAHFIHGA